jgi:hypothetical protein
MYMYFMIADFACSPNLNIYMYIYFPFVDFLCSCILNIYMYIYSGLSISVNLMYRYICAYFVRLSTL